MDTKYRIIYEDPDNPNDPLSVVTPSSNWMSKAMRGDLMPIDVWWRLQDEWEQAKAEGSAKVFKHSKDLMELQHTAPRVGPLTEEQAIEYLCMKDLPRACWSKKHNRPMFKIVTVDQIPADRTFRNSWELKHD